MLNELISGEVSHGAGFKTIASVFPRYAWLDEVVDQMIQQDPDKRLKSINAVKRQLIGREQNYVTRQRLSETQNVVIPVGNEDDPLVLDPPEVIDFDWHQGMLALILSRPVNPD